LKKSVAIGFLFLQLFSLCGQIVLYQFFLYKSNKFFNEQISKNRYKIDDLVDIKVPVTTPNIQDWSNYVNIKGQVQFKNTCYNYVKLKITRDTIYLKCVPNYESTRLFNQNIINAKQIADIPFNKKEHVPFGKVNSLGMYNYQAIQFRFSIPVVLVKRCPINIPSNIIYSTIPVPGQPPEVQNSLS